MSKPNDVILTQEMSTIDYSKYKKLGMESETIKKSQIKSASDAFKSRAGHKARLNHDADYWCSEMAASERSPQWLEVTFDTDTKVSGIFIQVSDVTKWLEHIRGVNGRDFPEENNLTHFFVSYSEKKKPLLGAGSWVKLEKMETNYKWDLHKGISYHEFKTPFTCRRIRLNCTKTLGGWCPALKIEWVG